MSSEYGRVFKAFSDEKRVRILELLCESEECACVLLDELDIKQPTLSHHMKILCDSGIVKSRRVGKWSYYSINESGCEYANMLLGKLIKKNLNDIMKFALRMYAVTSPVKKLFHVNRSIENAGDSKCTCCPK